MMEGWVSKVRADLTVALCQHGRYTFEDKGPGEVMDINAYADELGDLEGEEAGALLEELASRGEDDARVASAILGQLDDSEEGWWEACCDAAPSVEY